MMIPAMMTPRKIAIMASRKRMPIRLAPSAPDQAPVPGIGIPTNSINAIKAHRFILSPVEHMACKQENDGDGDHVGDNGNNI